MNIRTYFTVTASMLLCLNVSWAEDGDGAEATIRLMGVAEAELPEAVTNKIMLPAAVVDEDVAAVDEAMRGLDTANENRERREEGLTQADDAWDRGAEMVDEALNNQESRGRSDPPIDPGPPSD